MAITLTLKAAEHIRKTVEREQLGGLRVGVQGGGCSGLSYVLRFEKEPTARDLVFESDGARLWVDPKSLQVLDGMQLDYQETLMERHFLFENPNATKTCSCGTSFNA
jgi:iron-sulfur cluster assembly protein